MRKMANAQITVIGNLGGDAEIKTLPSGKVITNLNVAFTPSRKQGDSWVDGETMWFRVTAWEELASLVYSKGQRVIVTGALTQSTYTSKDGAVKTSLEISADTVGIVSKGASAPKADDWPTSDTSAAKSPSTDFTSDIPF
jgi:single-strand DNA-binding protein